jgi:hypothetical protein
MSARSRTRVAALAAGALLIGAGPAAAASYTVGFTLANLSGQAVKVASHPTSVPGPRTGTTIPNRTFAEWKVSAERRDNNLSFVTVFDVPAANGRQGARVVAEIGYTNGKDVSRCTVPRRLAGTSSADYRCDVERRATRRRNTVIHHFVVVRADPGRAAVGTIPRP